MKVTVCIDDTKIVVPCGDGDLSVQQLAQLAILRYRKSALSKGSFPECAEIKSLKLARDGGVLDWDDKVNDVLDDRDMLIAQYSSNVQLSTTGSPCPTSLSSPPLPHHNRITSGDIITSDPITTTSSHSPQLPDQIPKLPPISTKYVPLSFVSSMNPDLYNIRHNSIPCSDHNIHRHFDFFDNTTNARHESLDDILDLNNPNRRLHNLNSLNPTEYEKWPLPPFPTLSTLQSSTATTVLSKKVNMQLQDTDPDDLTWDNSPNDDCDEEDYPRLRPDYIVKHFKTNQDKSIENSVPSRQVLQWLESQDCGSVSSGGGGGGGSAGISGVGTLSCETSGDIKPTESINNAAIVLDDRNNNQIHTSFSSVSSANDHNRLRENMSFDQPMTTQHQLPQQVEDSIIVRLTNIKPGENLGIQIVPAYVQINSLDPTFANSALDNESKCLYGIEVHSIVPKGRVSKERQLNKGDKIIQINDVHLMGMPYERCESFFREALQKSECKLRIIPYQYPHAQPNKSNPPPPPRRSPNTALSVTKSSSVTSDKGVVVTSCPQQRCKSPLSNSSVNIKNASCKLNPAPQPPPIQQKPVASWTSGLGSMVHTPASSTSSVSATEKRKLDQMINNMDTPKTELIELTKIGSGFGFSITGVDNLPPNIPTAVYVRHILPDGAAIRDGRLKSDDRLLEVDGLLLNGMSQSEVISLLREKPSGSRVKLLVLRNSMQKNNPCSASHDSLMTSLSEMDEDGSTLSKHKKNVVKLRFDIPLNDNSGPNNRTSLGISVKVEPNWNKANIPRFSSKDDIAASNIVLVKTVIENGAAHRHGKLMVGDQLLEVNGISLSGRSSDDALGKLKTIIKDAQDSEEGIINVLILRNINMARSSSLNTLNSMTASGSVMSYQPIFDHSRHYDQPVNNMSPINFSGIKSSVPNSEPNRLMSDQPNTSCTQLSSKSFKRSAPLPPTPDPGRTDCGAADKSTKSKPVPPPPPLARRLKNIESCFDNCQVIPQSVQSTSEVSTVNEHHYASYAYNQIIKPIYQSDEFPPKNLTEPQCSSTTNTLCRNKETSQLMLRSRNTRSNCSYTPTKEILHIDDIDWDKMELIPFDNCRVNTELVKPLHNASCSQPVINQDIQLKKSHDTGVHKRKAFKKFSLGQMFKFKHSHYSKPSNSAGSSPIIIRKKNENICRKESDNTDKAIPTSSSSFSLKSSEPADETEFPYAELDFSVSPVVTTVPEITSVLLSTINNLKTNHTVKNTLLPLPEESFKVLQSHSSDESDSYEDFVDMQTTFPGHVSAVQRITAAMPKQPPNRFVYEDAEELFQSLQANVSLYHDINLSPTAFRGPSSFHMSPFLKEVQPDSKDLYQNIIMPTNLSPSLDNNNLNQTASFNRLMSTINDRHVSAELNLTTDNNSSDPLSLTANTDRDPYFNWPMLPK